MELKIDSRLCAVPDSEMRLPGLDAARTRDLNAMREGRTLRIRIPATPSSNALLGFASDPHALQKFNLSPHTAEVTDHGTPLFRGSVRLLEVSPEGFLVEIREGGIDWAKRAATADLAALDVSYFALLDATTIMESWEEKLPVVFLPIHRDDYLPQNSSSDFMPMIRALSIDDYHPFLHLRTLIDTLFKKTGYALKSKFMDSAFFRSLYISGAYRTRHSRNADNRMGFLAGRISEATAQADSEGRVYTDVYRPFSTIGNFVETATPRQLNDEGKEIPDLKNNGNCFKIIDGQIAYQPLVDTVAQFEFYLKYYTGHRIVDREHLAGFDTIFTGRGVKVRFTIPNRYIDHRAKLTDNHLYQIFVFNHREGNTYRLSYTLNGQSYTDEEFTTRTHPFGTLRNEIPTDPQLLLLNAQGNWVPYLEDWALYDGFVEERGETLVEFRIRSDSQQLSADKPYFFNRMFFEGADPDTKLTLTRDCTLKVLFTDIPGYGQEIRFRDVAQIDSTQLSLLESVAQMFNLRFYTQDEARTVYIEPYDDFYLHKEPIDWRDKVVLTEPIRREDRSSEEQEYQQFEYRPGRGAVARFNLKEDTTLGRWRYHSPSYASLMGTHKHPNPLFEATLSSKGHFWNARSASVLEIGDRDAFDNEEETRSSRIVVYDGMKELPEGEQWNYPTLGRKYPYAWFHDAEQHRTLCFEDRDGARGLNRYHQRALDERSHLERITLTLRLSPAEFAQLKTDHDQIPNLRSVFLVATGNGTIRATLRKTEAYAPQSRTVVATFDRIAQD